MIQVFSLNKSLDKDLNLDLQIISGSALVKFFVRKIVYFLLLVYSTLFLAVAIPFVTTPFNPIYYIGFTVSLIFLARLVNLIIMYIKYKNGKIIINNKNIEILNQNGAASVLTDNVTAMEINILGNLIIRESGKNNSFPFLLLSETSRNNLLSLLQDMSPKRTSLIKKVWEFIDAVAVALLLAVHIIQFVVQAYFIPTGSMMDTLVKGDHLFVEKITFGPVIPKMLGMDKVIHLNSMGIRGIKRRDIVIFRPPHEKDKDYIKRCIAIPGDLLEIKDGFVFINGKKQDESAYVKGITRDDPKNSKVQGVVPKGKIVVLGDNRENSMDGRYFGYLDIEKIKGKAFFLYWNTEQIIKFDFSRIGLIK